ncbi:MAG: hypothetical protein ACK55I_08950, partial [bacterium]
MIQIRQQVLTNAEVPIRVAGPFDIDVIGPGKTKLDTKVIEFIDNGSVKDPPKLLQPTIAATKCKPLTMRNDIADVDRLQTYQLLHGNKIGTCLLQMWVDLHKSNFLRVMSTKNGISQQTFVLICIDATEERGAAVELICVD